MKKNLIYLIGFLFSVSMTFMGCSEEAPSYTDLAINTNSLSIDKDAEGEVQIINGNGNYIVTVENENIASATLNGNVITVKGLVRGTTTLTIRDWARSTQIVNVKVNEIVDLKLNVENIETNVFVGEIRSIPIYSGNPEYTLTVADPAIVKAEVVENNILFTPITKGETTVTLADAAGKSLEIPVKVIEKFVLDTETSLNIGLDVATNINILSGNGGYEFSGSALTYCTAEVTDNVLTITGTGVNKKNMDRLDLTITDQKGQKVTLKIFSDYPFLENNTPRFRNFFLLGMGAGDYSLWEGNNCKSSTTYHEDVDMTYLTMEAVGILYGFYDAGWAIRFSGKLAKGKKKNAHRATLVMGQSAGGEEEVDIESFEVVKVEGKTYWVVYYDPKLKQDIYLVVKAS